MCQESKDTDTTIIRTTISRTYYLFRIGKLQFGFHGVFGIICIIVTSIAIYYPSYLLLFVLPSQICNLILVNDAYHNLLQQVPKSTQIFPGVVAPHKEAFQRTIFVIQYLIVRIIMKCLQQQLQLLSATEGDYNNFYFSILESIVILWRYYPLVPQFHYMDWYNGNTWIFVIPIFIGVSGDIYVYITYGNNVFKIQHLLMGELLGLYLAFGFTLGFRHYIPMPIVYCGAAIAVYMIIQQGITTVKLS